MKKILLFIVLSAGCTGAFAQELPATVTETSVTVEGDMVRVGCRIDVPRKAIRSNEMLLMTPSLVNGTKKKTLEPVIVQGYRAAVSEKRERLSKKIVRYPDAVRLRAGQGLDYEAIIPYETWMEGSTLKVAATMSSCGTDRQLPSTALTGDLALRRQSEPEPEPQIPAMPLPEKVLSTGDRLAEIYPFVAPSGQYVGNRTAENSVTVYFRVNRWTPIEPGYMGNGETLELLSRVIRDIAGSADSRITQISITGYASPEGPEAYNEKLSRNRADALRDYLVTVAGVDTKVVTAAGRGENWEGLRELVAASDQPWRDEVLRIIDTVPVWDAARQVGRQGTLMRLQGGEPYRYMLQNFFPLLRNAVYIRVYYENR